MGQTGRLALALAVALWTETSLAGLRLAGSSATLHLVRETAAYFSQDTGVPTQAVGGGSDAGIRAVAGGTSDIGIAARLLSSRERQTLQARLLAYDGIALIVHERNPLTQLSADQVHGIFEGRLANWSELGDRRQPGAVIPVLRSPTRAARQQFDEHFGIAPLLPPRSIELGSDLAVLLYVSSDPQAIGYVSIGMLADARQRGLRVKGVALDGVEPTPEGCASRRYALCRPLLAVTRGMPQGSAKQFLDFLASPAGRDLIRRHGFSPPQEPGS